MDVQAKFVEQELGAAELISVNAANIPMRAIEWLWPNRLAYGKLGLLGGLPDMGKGLITAFMMACITTRMEAEVGQIGRQVESTRVEIVLGDRTAWIDGPIPNFNRAPDP